MGLPYHRSFTGTQLHRVARDFADAAELAAFTPVATDVGKLYKQLDTGVVYELTNHVGPVYVVFNAAGVALALVATNTHILQASGYALDAEADDDYEIALSPAIVGYEVGALYRFRANTANTGAATLDINGVGAQAIKKLAGGVTTALETGDIRAGQWVAVVWDGTNFQMTSASGLAPFTALTKTDILQAAMFGVDSGAADAYVLTLAPAITSYITGVKYGFKAANANTGASTVDINGLGVKAIKKMVDGTATALAANDIRANQWCDLIYDGTDMLLQSPLGNDVAAIAQAYTDAAVSKVPQNSQSAAYTLVLSDAGKHILHPSADTTARIFTIPANASVAYPIGTVVTFVNQDSAGVITIAITTDTMRLAGAGTTGSRTLAANGIATAIKVTSTEWLISGTGLT